MSDGENEEQQQLDDAEDDAAGTASPLVDGRPSDDGAAAEDPKFAALLEKLHAEHNFDFREYKPGSLLRRIRRRMTQVHVERFESYMSYLDKHADEHIALLNAILINVTRFFRDPEAWDVLRDHVLPSMIDAAATSRSLRCWSAGCSSGEEAYTLAMLLTEYLRGRQDEYDIKIYATDIDDDALTTARSGLYRLEAVKDVPAALIDRYFTPDGQAYRVRRDIRKWCIFGHHDLTHDAPLSHVDLLVCRNVLIYFDNTLQDRVVPRFQYAIRPEGYLFLGRSESMLSRARRFVPVGFKWRIFQRVTGNEPDVVATSAPDRQARLLGPRPDPLQIASRLGGILENIGSGIVVIDPAETIVVWNPAAEHLFEVPADGALGRKFRDLDVSYRIDGLRARIEEVRTTQTHAQMQNVVFARRGGDTMHVSVRIAPLFDERRRPIGIMICANDMGTVSQLRDELDRLAEQSATANEELQSTNEELETTNEELQSTNEELETTNEELQSTNEELETTIEELQSTNAELTTLNVELERRTADLHRLEAFERSVLNAIGPALFVIDPSLVVTNWNAAAARLWGISAEGAVGREFSSLPSERLVRVAREPLQRVIATHGTERLTGVPRAQVDGGVTLDLIPVLSAAGELLGVLGAVREGAGEILGN